MERLKSFFQSAETCRPDERLVGAEVETMFVDKKGKPISWSCSQAIFWQLYNMFGWNNPVQKNSSIVGLEKVRSRLCYELGCHNLELITRARLDSDFLADYYSRQLEINRAAKQVGAYPLAKGFDGYRFDNLAEPDDRDRIWRELDGPALFPLGHIACVHFNIDLQSIDEGFRFIGKLIKLYEEKDWFNQANGRLWRDYIRDSHAGYENDRYGLPPKSFNAYCRKLAKYKVVMLEKGGVLHIADPAIPFSKSSVANLDLFLRSVWWIFRLRVRSGRLVLEIRDVPRHILVEESRATVRETLRI